MHKHDLDRVEFYSKEDMAGGYELAKGEHILRNSTQSNYTDLNDILEIYNIKKYIDNEIYLKRWTQEDIINFKQKVINYEKEVGKFMSNINDTNVVDFYEKTSWSYIDSFWELVNNQSIFKRISKTNFNTILNREPHIIHIILTYKYLVEYYDAEIKSFLLLYSKSAEILLSTYETEDDSNQKQKFFPKSLTVQDKESIISKYLDLNDVNLNYIKLTQNIRNRNDFKISDKTRLKAKRLHKSQTEKLFADKGGMAYGVSISFPENAVKIKDEFVENLTTNYSYSLSYIKQNNDSYSLFRNFKILFEYLDNQNRINLVSKKSKMGVMERVIGIHSQNEYRHNILFDLSEMTSYTQIVSYGKIVSDLNNSLENILHFVYTSTLQEEYNFADNALFSVPTTTNSYFEKVRLLAPEFESILKQFKLFVEDGIIDFELLQISSSPSSIKDIPSLNLNKYIYFNKNNQEMVGCSNLLFSDQTLLTYVEPFKEKHYHNFFDLLANEQVNFNNYEEYQKPQINYLIGKGLILLDMNEYIQIKNVARVLIFKDLHDNEVSSFYHYPTEFQKEAQQMASEEIILFESSLFSKPEQAYFNYFLNKSEFTNGLDLRNSYLHGTQANPDETQKHEYAYFTYLKLLFLAMLKIEDDLFISNALKV